MSKPNETAGAEPVAGPPPHAWTANWFARLSRSEGGTPLVPAEFVAGQGPGVRLIDVRDPQHFVGSLGYIPGADWIPVERLDSLAERLGTETPLVVVSGSGERASGVARMLEAQGMRYVAALAGGMEHWLSLGFRTTRDPSILDRCDVLGEIVVPEFQEGEPAGLSIEQVQQHLGDPLSVCWIKLAALVLHTQLSCIDGRDDRSILGTPGGDAGQFLLVMAAIESVIGRRLDQDVILALLERRIDAFGGFYMHTDQGTVSKVVESMRQDPRLEAAISEYASDPTEWRQFLRRPPLMLRDAVLEHLCKPDAIGCGHIRLMNQHAADYRVRPGLVLDVLCAFFRTRWDGAFRAELESLHGQHNERAVLITRIDGPLHPFTPIPLISPSFFESQMFIYHPQVSEYLFGLLVDFFLLQTDLVPEFEKDIRAPLLAEIKSLDAIHTKNSLGHLAKGLPIYDVTFRGEGEIQVEFVAFVE